MGITRTNLVTEQNIPHEFVKLNWVSEAAQQLWSPIFSACSNFFTSLEQATVRAGVRQATIQMIDPRDLDEITLAWIRNDFLVVPIDKVQETNIYQSSGSPCDIERPWRYKVAIGKFEAVRDLVYAYKTGDNQKIGEALGYPSCCIEFFNNIWTKENWIDTTYPMARGLSDHHVWSPYCNVLLRWIGLRFVSHLPCSFNCLETQVIGQKYHDLACSLRNRTVSDALYDILSWPIEWSGLHGIGLITTPVFRATVRTDMLKEKRSVRLHSNKIPQESQYGLSFPFPQRKTLSFKRNNANGFSSEAAQNQAHNMILDLIRYSGIGPATVLDLGCGDSTLLKKIEADFGARPTGVDSDASKNPSIVGDVFEIDLSPGYDLILLSRARIFEDPIGWNDFVIRLETSCKWLILYSYDGDQSDVNVGDFKFIAGAADGHLLANLYEAPSN